jgi:peroxiredoxin Q/BCP
VKAGDRAPDFTLTDADGTRRRLTDLVAAGPVVLFWYPAAMTPGCTREACHFRDLAAEFARAGAQRVGISMDAEARQKQFATAHGLDFPLLADPDGAVSAQYGVKRRGPLAKIGPTQRKTFVIGPDQRILDIITGEFSFTDHADKALAVLASTSAS